ncbi:uncharacterized protein SPSK_03793 [Sporothrix schenckii 1099-18]|uniref:Uncharacterized protein n=1 Tax=Sporothrix schenckii 1099-18 TaxID=1397361 RepID=A0A0F2LWZ3_SPOSC|nr:uncharacterized protein SPSK_03793 [Sporothrix schenckii 1099-18]KJR81967.1 hypothetical protein SPSK_03793 [Sporothrix schenckii 1099-18]
MQGITRIGKWRRSRDHPWPLSWSSRELNIGFPRDREQRSHDGTGIPTSELWLGIQTKNDGEVEMGKQYAVKEENMQRRQITPQTAC